MVLASKKISIRRSNNIISVTDVSSDSYYRLDIIDIDSNNIDCIVTYNKKYNDGIVSIFPSNGSSFGASIAPKYCYISLSKAYNGSLNNLIYLDDIELTNITKEENGKLLVGNLSTVANYNSQNWHSIKLGANFFNHINDYASFISSYVVTKTNTFSKYESNNYNNSYIKLGQFTLPTSSRADLLSEIYNRYNIHASQVIDLQYKDTICIFIYADNNFGINNVFPPSQSNIPYEEKPESIVISFNRKLGNTVGIVGVDSNNNRQNLNGLYLFDRNAYSVDVSNFFSGEGIFSLKLSDNGSIKSINGDNLSSIYLLSYSIDRFPRVHSVNGEYGDVVVVGGSGSGNGSGVSDHGLLTGLGDDDHTQYLNTARANVWLTGNLSFTGHTGNNSIHFSQSDISITSSQVSNFTEAAQDVIMSSITGASGIAVVYNDASNLLTINFTGSFTGGNGVSDHGLLTGLEDNDHPQYTLVTSFTGHSGNFTNPHNVTATQVGAPTIAQFTGHTGDSSIHFTVSSIDHGLISGLSDNDHPQYTLVTTFTGHTGNYSNPHQVTANQVGAPTTAQFTGHTGNSAIHFTQSEINHDSIQNIGFYPHTEIDDHINANVIHIDHSSIIISGNASDFSGGGSIDSSRTIFLKDTGVTGGSYGSASSVAAFTVNSKGRLTFAYNQPISVTSSSITDFNESVDDRVSSLLVGGTGIALVYNDGSNTLTIDYIGNTGGAGYTDEQAQDAVGNILVSGSDILLTYSDVSGSISGSLTDTAATPGSFGGSKTIPVFTVNSKGRITASSTAALITSSDTWTGNFVFPAASNSRVQAASGSDLILRGDNSIASSVTSVTIAHSSSLTQNKTTYIADFRYGAGSGTKVAGIDTLGYLNCPGIDIDSVSGRTASVQFRSNINMAGFSLTGLPAPSAIDSAATKTYVDSHTGNLNLHYLQSEISISSTQVSNFNEAVDDRVGALITGQSGISVLYNDASNQFIISFTGSLTGGSSVSGNYADNSAFTGHTGNTGIHFTQDQISITGGQISDLDAVVDYRVSLMTTLISGHSGINAAYNDSNDTIYIAYTGEAGGISVASFTGHTGDTSIHFTQSSISITASQVSDFSEAVDDRVGASLIGTSGVSVSYDDASNLINLGLTGMQHYLLKQQRKHPIYSSDFHSNNTNSNPPWIGTAISAGTSQYGGGELNYFNPRHPGTIGIQSHATNINAGYRWVTAPSYQILGNREYLECIYSPSSMRNAHLRIGFLDSTTHAPPTDGVYWECISGFGFSGIIMNNNVRFANTGNYTVNSGDWYRFTVEVNSPATSATFSIYSGDTSDMLLYSNVVTGVLPTGSGRLLGHGLITTRAVGGVVLLGFIDYMAYTNLAELAR